MSKFLSNPIILIFFTLIFVIFYMSLQKNEEKIKISTQSINSLETEVLDLKREVEQAEINVLNAQEPLNKEKIIRDQLLMQKDGEIILQIPEIERNEAKIEVYSTSPWEKWMELLF